MRRSSPLRLVLVTVALCAPALAQTPATPATAPSTPAANPPGGASPGASQTVAKPGPSPYSEAVQRGDGAYLARDFDGAIAAYRQEIEKHPNAALGHYRLGEAELAKADFVAAEQSFQTALKLAGNDVVMRGKVLFELADLKERQKAYDDAVERWKTYAEFATAQPSAKVYPTTAAERLKRADEWKKISAAAAEVKVRIEKRLQEADESMKKSSK